MIKIDFNKPYFSGKENSYILRAVKSGQLSGDGYFTKKCENFFEKKYKFKKCLLTTSCTDALEMAALLLKIKPGDEVIAPSFTFVSTVNAFVLRGAKIIFADSEKDSPNIDAQKIEELISEKTKALVIVHYAGVACDMEHIMSIIKKHKLFLVEDCAHAIDSFYKNKPLGSFGNLAAFSFHESKNIHCGEGGMLVINDSAFLRRAEIIREKGTNRSAFFRGEIEKYEWIDVGSSFLPSEINAAFLYAQLEKLRRIQVKRKKIWHWYYESLKQLHEAGKFRLPELPEYASNNAHLFYIIIQNTNERNSLIRKLRQKSIYAVSHYLPLNKSPFYLSQNVYRSIPNAEKISAGIIRLPLHFALSRKDINTVTRFVKLFYNGKLEN